MKKEQNNNDLLDLPDCIYLSERGKCNRLNIADCQGKNCSFKQTNEENQEQKSRWAKQLSSLDDVIQIKIAKKYYYGAMPWKQEFTNKRC